MASGDSTTNAASEQTAHQAAARLVIGTMNFGDTIPASEGERILDAAAEAGIVMYDTANVYSDGAAEEILGKWARRRADCDLEIATKVGIPRERDAAPLARKAVLAEVTSSLQRLGRDRVALLYLHQPDRATPIAETLSAVHELYEKGVVGQLGVSNYAAWQVEVVDREAERIGGLRPVVAQQLYNLVARDVENEYLEYARSKRISTIAYNPLAGGLLARGGQRLEEVDAGRFATSSLASLYRQRYWREPIVHAVRLIADVAAIAGISAIALAYRWLLGNPGIDRVVVGASNAAHVHDAIDAAEAGPLPGDVLSACAEIGNTLHGVMPRYNR